MDAGRGPARLWQTFARVLEYPHERPAAVARECAALLRPVSIEAAAVMDRFAAFAGDVPRGELEETYTRTFDLDPTRCPYVGFHLFGETYKRSVFLVRLKTLAREAGVELGSELPDHVAAVLRVLAASTDDDFTAELATAALLPAVRRMAAGEEAGSTGTADGDQPGPAGAAASPAPAPAPYRAVLDALRVALERCYPAPAGDTLEPAAAATGGARGRTEEA
jgi:nitrate reductase delta subunit